ncbi:MAG: PAS domain-containing protein [Alphaproteobacteria bacterium]
MDGGDTVNDTKTIFDTVPGRGNGTGGFSPLKYGAIVVGATFFAEVTIMAVLDWLGDSSSLLYSIMDAGVVSLLVLAVVYFIGIKPLKKIAASFRESEGRFYTYARTSSDWFWAMGPDLCFTSVSETFEERTGISPHVIIGRRWEDVCDVIDLPPDLAGSLARLNAHEPVRNMEVPFREAAGDVQWFSVTGQPQFSAKGEFLGYFGTGNDITLDKYHDLELKRSKSLVDGILRTSLDAFLVLGAVRSQSGDIVDFRFLHANNKAGEIVGRQRQDLLGKLFRREVPMLDEGGLLERVIETVETGEPFDIEHLFEQESLSGWFRIVGVKLDDGAVITFSDITSLKMAESGLRDAIESIPEGFVLWDAQGRLIVCNSNYRHIYASLAGVIEPGTTFEELTKLAVDWGLVVTDGPSQEWMEKRVARHRKPAGPYEEQLTDGRWLKVSDRRTGDGRTVSIHSDITDLKQREQALIESQARLAEAQRIGHLGWWNLDIVGDQIHWSDEVYRIFGIDDRTTRPTYETLVALVHPDDRERVQQAIAAAVNHNRPYSLERRVVRPDGTQRLVHEKGEVSFDAGGNPRQLLVTLLDITDRKMIEDELLRSEERFHLATMGANEGIWDWDIHEDRLYVSSRYCEVLGCGGEEGYITHAAVRGRIDPQHLEKYTSRLEEHFAGKTSFFSCEYRVPSPSGEGRWILERGLALRDSQGTPYRMAGSITDVTERRTAEDRLLHTQKMEALGQLAGGVAHEFNNLLTGIGGFARMAQKKPGDVERVTTCLEEIIMSADRSAEITRQLLKFSRREEETKVQVIYPSTALKGMTKMLESLIGANVSLRIDIADKEARCLIDPGQLSQVLVNLAVNARDAMPHGGEIVVATRLVAAGTVVDEKTNRRIGSPHVCISVQDHGTGIDEKTLKRIYEPFFSTKEQGKGTGLGLSITYGIVDNAGGFIHVDSEVGRGTTFSIYLPLSVDEATITTTATVTEGVQSAGEVVLVVDDEKSIRSLARAVLDELGYKVVIAGDGVEALDLLKVHEGRIDLLLTDVAMPRMGGIELARHFITARPGARIRYMSGYPDREIAKFSEPIDPASLLPKPFTPEKLAEFVRDALG